MREDWAAAAQYYWTKAYAAGGVEVDGVILTDDGSEIVI